MARHGRSFPIKAHINYQGRTGIYFNRTFLRSISESVLNGASRLVTVTRVASFARTASASIMNAVSRLATLYGVRKNTLIAVYINGVERTTIINWKTLRKEQVSTKEPDTLTFDLKNSDTATYRPALGDTITMYDTDGTTLIFGGTVIYTEEKVDGLLKVFRVYCKDYSHTLDRELVAVNYTSQTVAYIVNDLITNYASGFTNTNTTDTTVVEYIQFNYLTVSECLKKLANTLGNYSWYVDYSKDIHFYPNSSVSAPFSLADDSNNFVWNSLTFNSDLSQIRNHIILRGGTTTGTAFSDFKIADGQQNTFFVGYNLVNYTFYKALAASPSTFVALTSGPDGITDPTTVDVLYNPNNGLIRFANSNTPAVNDVIKWTGTPTYPLIAEKVDAVSVGTYGTYKYVIVDKNITSIAAASQRMQAELARYSNPISGGKFQTYTGGLIAGQNINVNSAIRNINQNFKIDRITTTMRSPSAFKYDVAIVTTDNVTMQDVLNKLLITNVADQVDVQQDEILQILQSAVETVTIVDDFEVSIAHNMQYETITIADVETVQALNYPVEFVLGPITPTGFKRQFLLDSSPLA